MKDEFTTKKRRLESEVSQSSGITCLSNITQTTELSSDMEDNNSDSSSAANQTTEILYDRRPSATNDSAFKQTNYSRMKRAKKPLLRKRQVSWSIDDDTFESDDKGEEDNNPFAPLPYDNNFCGTNNSRRRVRRATESSLDTNALSFNKAQSPFGEQISNFQPKIRSNTTSQIHGHEEEIQRKLDTLIRMHDARLLQSGRSQSVTSLRNQDRLYNPSGSHLYESLHSQNTAQKQRINDQPLDTVVTLTSNDKNYLHPATETKVQINNFERPENNSGFSGDGSSAYADVVHHNPISTRDQGQKKCFDFCDNSFYRRGFFLLLIFNVILMLLNSVGLPFVYFAVRQEEPGPEDGVASALRSEMCFDVDKIHEKVKKQVCGDANTDDRQCCGSVEEFLQRFIKMFDEVVRHPPPEKSANVPAFQVKADSKKNKSNNNQTRIIWESRAEINTLDAKKFDTTIKIPKTGYYYVYSRVHYKKPGKLKHNGFTIGHTIKKEEKDGTIKHLDKVVQRCFPSNTSGDIIHTNQLGSLHHLKEGDGLFIQLDHKEYFVHENTILGWFMVSS